MGRKSRRGKVAAKTYRGTLDEVLANKNLWRKPIAKDGSCLFRAVAEQVDTTSTNIHFETKLFSFV